MLSVQWSLVYILILLASSTLFAQSNGWKIETLAPISTGEDSDGFIPTRRVAINNVGQIAFVGPDGVYVREPSGVITKRIDEVGALLSDRPSGYFETFWRTSVGIDDNGVVYAGQDTQVYRQAPGGPTEIIYSTQGSNLVLERQLMGDVLVTSTGSVFASTSPFFSGSDLNSKILKWNGVAFQPIYESAESGTPLFLLDATGDSVVFQSIANGHPIVDRFGRIDGSAYTDITPLQILDIVSSLSEGTSVALASNNAIAFVEMSSGSTSDLPLRVTKIVESMASSFALDGVSPIDRFEFVTCGCIIQEAEFGSLSMNAGGQIAYAARGLTGGYRGIFDGPDPAIDSIMPGVLVDGTDVRLVTCSTVHDVTESGEVVLTYIDYFGNSFLAKAIPTPSLVDLVNQSFIDGLDGWQTSGLVVMSTNQELGDSAVVIADGASISQEIDLPSSAFQIEVFIPPRVANLWDMNVYLGDHLLPKGEFAIFNPVQRYFVTDPSLLGQSNVTFRIAATNGTTIIDGIRITAVPEVPSTLLVAGMLGILTIVHRRHRFGR
jgi:hypothetical protein